MADMAYLNDKVLEDLRKSGLVPSDMMIRPLSESERGATRTAHSVDGYVIPYWDINGKLIKHYRVRAFDGPPYRQAGDASLHVYFPKKFPTVWLEAKYSYVVVVTTEKEAAKLVKEGIPACAIPGAGGWKTKTIIVAADAALSKANSKLAVKLDSEESIEESYRSPMAVGLQELMDAGVTKKTVFVLAFHSDNATGRPTNLEQRECALLGFELRANGVGFEKIKQLIMPTIVNFSFDAPNVGVDNFLVEEGIENFREMLIGCLRDRRRFPLHPNIREYLGKRLQSAKISRKEKQNIAMALISSLDATGIRLRSSDGTAYYFDKTDHRLIRTLWGRDMSQAFDSPFVQFLYTTFGLGPADQHVNAWVGTQFTSEQPIEEVEPQRVIARKDHKDDCVYYQLSDAQFARVDREGLKVCDNGDFNILFESGMVEPLNTLVLMEEFNRQKKLPMECWWLKVLMEVRMNNRDKVAPLIALLYYMSPWLLRWRGTQLPFELIMGEAGSGKSTLCELRLEILTGKPALRNTPQDLKDWYASITSTGGLHVIDNIQLTNRELKQQLSDEICRLVTEADPHIELRKLYTTADVMRTPVRTAFAMTGIQQPFGNADILQRSIILELDKSVAQNVEGDIRYDSFWKQRHLAGQRGKGREAWVAHHLLVLHRFFELVSKEWNPSYSASHRLLNFEQGILLMGKVFGIDASWIPQHIMTTVNEAVTDADWALSGIKEFARNYWEANGGGKEPVYFFCSDVNEWAVMDPMYEKCEILTNTRRLGRYLKAHKATIYKLTHIELAGMYGNRARYVIKHKPPGDES